MLIHIYFYYFRTNGTEITKIGAILYISFCNFRKIGTEIIKASVEISFSYI